MCIYFIKHIFAFSLSLFRNQFSTSKYFYKGYVWWTIPTIYMLTMWESSQDHGFSCFPWESANNSSLWKLIYNFSIWGSVYNSAIFVKESIAFSTLPHHNQEGVKRKCVLSWWEKEGVAWQLFPHTFLHSELQDIKKILLGRAIHIIYLNDNSVRPDPHLTNMNCSLPFSWFFSNMLANFLDKYFNDGRPEFIFLRENLYLFNIFYETLVI